MNMRKRFLAICLISAVLIAVLIPSCESAEERGTIIVKATLCGAPWEGAVNYTLTGPGGSPIMGECLPNLEEFGRCQDVECPGEWTCDSFSNYWATFVDIAPHRTQAVACGDTVVFTLNFEKNQDASIEFLTWTINGEPVAPNTIEEPYEVYLGDVINVNYKPHVDGCEGEVVTVNETSELLIHWVNSDGEVDEPSVHVANNWCAVVKEPEPEKLSQRPSFNGEPVEYCQEFYLPYCENVTLDVETSWQLGTYTDYIKTINWLYIGECGPQTPCCALFELLGEVYVDMNPLVISGYVFELESHASIKLVEDMDVNPDNDHSWNNPALYISSNPMPFP